MKDSRGLDETETESSEKNHTIGEYVVGIIIVLAVAVVKTIDVLHPVADWPSMHKIAEIEPTLLAAGLLTYVVFERLKFLGPTKKRVDRIAIDCAKLSEIPGREEITRLLNNSTAHVVEHLSNKVSVRMNDTAEATYKHILRVVESVEANKNHTVKNLRMGVFHAAGARNTTPEDTQQYFIDFSNKMRQMASSDEANRWNVKVLYNVTHPDRLSVILDRLKLGSAGYKVRALSLPDFLPVFSPMIVDEEHVFLAVFEEGKSRVSKSVYLHGPKAAKFFTEYFETLWSDNRVKILREEGTLNGTGIADVEDAVQTIASANKR